MPKGEAGKVYACRARHLISGRRVSPQRETRLSWRKYFRFLYQRDRILGKVTFGQNRSAPHTLYYKYKPKLFTSPARSTLLARLPLHLCLVMPLHIHNAATIEAAPSVDVFKRSATR